MSERRNVALIVLDTVRKDFFDEYAPRLNGLSDCSLNQCRVASPWSTPSHASMLTGELLHEHGVHANQHSFDPIPVEETFLADLDGYNRICATYHNFLQPKYQFNKFFDQFRTTAWRKVKDEVDFGAGLTAYLTFLRKTLTTRSPYEAIKCFERGLWARFDEQLLRLPGVKPPDQGATELMRIAKREVIDSSEPLFLFMNYLDAHSPYRVTKHLDPNLVSVPKTWEDGSYDVWEMNDNEALDNEYAHNYRELYGASIDYLDRKVSDLIQHMQNTTAQETTVVITADHGHNLGYPKENYLFGHNCTVSEGVLHVPLEIVNPPDGFPRQVEESFSHLDLGDLLVRLAQGLPSIDDLVGSYAPAEVEGFTIPGNKSHKFPGTTREWEHWDRMRRVCYVNHKKYEWDSLGNIKRYNIDRERPCWQALAEEDCELPAVADDLFVTGIKEYKRHIDSLGTDTGVKDDLQALGYI